MPRRKKKKTSKKKSSAGRFVSLPAAEVRAGMVLKRGGQVTKVEKSKGFVTIHKMRGGAGVVPASKSLLVRSL